MTEHVETVELRRVLAVLMERSWILAVSMVVCVLLGFFIITRSPRMYESTAVVEVPLEAQQVVASQEGTEGDFRSQDVLKTFEANLQRRSLYARVLAREEIAGRRELFQGVDLSGGQRTPEQVLEKWTRVELRRGTRLIDVTVEHRVPEMAALLANALVEEFMRERASARSGSSQSAFQFLIGEAERVREKLRRSEEALQDYQKGMELKAKIMGMQTEMATLGQRYLEKHPKLVQARTLLDSTVREFRGELGRVRQRLGVEDPVFAEQWKGLEGLAGEERLEAELKLIESRFNVLNREVESDRGLYDSIMTQMKERDVTREIESDPFYWAERAVAGAKPAKPVVWLILLISVVAGAGTGLGGICVLHLLDNTMKTVDLAEETTGLPVLASVPMDRKLKSGKAAGMVMRGDAGGLAAESIRTLRTSLKLLGPESERRRFLVTSAVPGEGKTFVAANLAVAFAQEQRRTLLIDADLRRPRVHEIMGNVDRDRGLVQVLVRECGLAEAVQPGGIPGLDVLASGPVPPNPAELLSGPVWEELMAEVAEHYDRIIIDTAPVIAVSDTLMLLPSVETAVLVAHAGKTPRKAVRRAIQALAKSGRTPAGLVLNQVPMRAGLASDPYYYHYSAAEGYGKAYGTGRKA